MCDLVGFFFLLIGFLWKFTDANLKSYLLIAEEIEIYEKRRIAFLFHRISFSLSISSSTQYYSFFERDAEPTFIKKLCLLIDLAGFFFSRFESGGNSHEMIDKLQLYFYTAELIKKSGKEEKSYIESWRFVIWFTKPSLPKIIWSWFLSLRKHKIKNTSRQSSGGFRWEKKVQNEGQEDDQTSLEVPGRQRLERDRELAVPGRQNSRSKKRGLFVADLDEKLVQMTPTDLPFEKKYMEFHSISISSDYCYSETLTDSMTCLPGNLGEFFFLDLFL